jgi:predicted nucleic acid-binding protein
VSVFFDTNVLLYADDADAGDKATVARELLREAFLQRTGVISVQVLQEYFVNACRKLRLEAHAARARLEIYGGFDVVVPNTALVLEAIDLHRLDTISFWDALVVCSAQRAGCSVVYSEDLQHGRRFGRLRVVNPFA